MGCWCSSPTPVAFDGNIQLQHFKLLRSVGKGAFGKVCIVQKRDDKELFAMKYMNKSTCIEKKALANVINEAKILRMLDHTFLVNLWFTFQDDEDMFMVMDLMMGGDMRFQLSREGGFSENRVRVYMAELGCVLHYIHSMKVIHRDIKPDNILLDREGHAHLADFNVSVFLPEEQVLSHKAGTKLYMAPEIFLNNSYAYPCDWWSLGITMLEMLLGSHPFKGQEGHELAKSICCGHLKYPSSLSSAAVSLLDELLQHDPAKRLGHDSKWSAFQSHEFFAGISWDNVADRGIVPAFKPNKDKVNCDAMYELEEMMLEENPLHKKKQRHAGSSLDLKAVSTLDPEIQHILDQFGMYNRMDQRKIKSRGNSADKGSTALVNSPSETLLLEDEDSFPFELDSSNIKKGVDDIVIS